MHTVYIPEGISPLIDEGLEAGNLSSLGLWSMQSREGVHLLGSETMLESWLDEYWDSHDVKKPQIFPWRG